MIELDYLGEDLFLLIASNDFGDLVHVKVRTKDVEELLKVVREYEGTKTFKEIYNEQEHDTYTIYGKQNE